MLTTKSKKYILIGIVFHLIAAFFSIGFYSHDEQRQILQTVGHLLDQYDASYMSYQYSVALRSLLQPAFYAFISKIYLLFSHYDPNHLALLYRIVSSMIGASSLWVLYKTFENELSDEKYQSLYFFFAGLLYFLPFLHARTSNENFSSSFFIFGLYYLKNHSKWKNIALAGALFSICVMLRMQLAVMVASSTLWFIVYEKLSFKKIIFLIICFLFILAQITYLDSHYYGYFVFSPYNYFYVNIVLKYAAEFGETPWYNYFVLIFKNGPTPLGLFFLATYLVLWIKFPKNLITWITLPFLIAHSFIGHKELRFLFPLVFLIPFTLTFLIKELQLTITPKMKLYFLIINTPLLIYFSITPASNLMKYYEYLYYNETNVHTVYVTGPYEDYTKFYLKNDIEYRLYNLADMKNIINSDKNVFFFTMNIKERDLLLENPQCKSKFSLFPKWIYDFEFIKKRRTFRSWTFVECSN